MSLVLTFELDRCWRTINVMSRKVECYLNHMSYYRFIYDVLDEFKSCGTLWFHNGDIQVVYVSMIFMQIYFCYHIYQFHREVYNKD